MVSAASIFIKGKERERIIKSLTVKLGEARSSKREREGMLRDSATPEFPCYLLLEIAPSICFALDPRESSFLPSFLPSFHEFRCSGRGEGEAWIGLIPALKR